MCKIPLTKKTHLILFIFFIWITRLFSVDIDACKYLNINLPDCGFQKAIDDCSASGGGTVKIPEGVFKITRGLVLKNNVSIEGKGIDKTIFVQGRDIVKINVVKLEGNRIYLESIPEKMEEGSAVVLCRIFPPAWYGEPRPAFVKELDKQNNSILVEAPYGMVQMKPGAGCVIFGDSAVAETDIKKGDTEILLKSAKIFKPGEEIAIGEPPNESMLAHGFIKEIKGNKLVLESPVSIDFKLWPPDKEMGNKKINALLWGLSPVFHGANVENVKISSMTIKGNAKGNVYSTQGRYTLAAIHIYNGKNIVIEKTKVIDWASDGISLQGGNSCVVRECEIYGCTGNGLHPGTGLKNSVFEKNKIIENGQGIYFCWHNFGHKVLNNLIERNRSHGIGGLGNPGDTNNLIEGNQIIANGEAGIEINGGRQSSNIIMNNIIKNNSQSQPGKFPGIMIYAATEDAMYYTIKNNDISDTQDKKTQRVGIEEKNGAYREKPVFADKNLIEDNILSGHEIDIIVAGQNTVCRNNKATKIVMPEKKDAQ